ncbi:MAG TPA: hypothetical protein VEV16_00960 [Daejeonella sp.]|nr:hypothetical protein [Daejeonella sp.]
MKTIRTVLAILVFSMLSFSASNVSAQCSLCTLSAENSVKNGNTQGAGLNDGILYLLAAPYLALAGVGFLWYKKYRRKDVAITVKDEKINMN